jgi:hypothetical protein
LLLPQTRENRYHLAFQWHKARMFRCARKEAPPVMQSSAAVAVRALVMLACVVGIPLLAMSGTSWSEVLKKFQNFHLPAILTPAQASPAAAQSEAPRFPSSNSKNLPSAQRELTAAALAGPASAPSQACSMPSPLPVPPKAPACAAAVGAGFRDIPERLQELGATYYLLESWGNEQELYRFYCKMAVAGNADYTHCFEAIHADPLQAMRQVLRQVETWKTDKGRRTADD